MSIDNNYLLRYCVLKSTKKRFEVMSESENNTRQRTSYKNTNYYINNKELYDEILKSQELGYMTDELGKMIMLVAERVSNHKNFVRYPYKEDLVNEGILHCCKAWHKFDPERSDNPLAFLTTSIMNAFKQKIKREYAYKNIKDSVMVDKGLNPSYGYEEGIEAMERRKQKQRARNHDEDVDVHEEYDENSGEIEENTDV